MTQRMGQLSGCGVAQQAFIQIVSQQHPVFVFAHTKQIRLFVQLDAIGLFRPAPGRITSALDFGNAVIHKFGDFGVVLNGQRRVFVFVLGGDCPAVVGVDVNNRQMAEIDLILANLVLAVISFDSDPLFVVRRCRHQGVACAFCTVYKIVQGVVCRIVNDDRHALL